MTLAIGCNLLYLTSSSFLCFVHTIHKEHTAGSRMPVQRHRKTLFTHSSASVSMSSPSYKFARNTARNTAYSCIFIVQTSSQNGTVGTKDLSTCPITNEICPQFCTKILFSSSSVALHLFSKCRFGLTKLGNHPLILQNWYCTNTVESTGSKCVVWSTVSSCTCPLRHTNRA